MMSFAVGTARAQDLSGWVGKWLKLTGSSKGYEATWEGNYIPQNESKTVGPAYMKITAWDTTNPSDPFLRCSEYDQGGGQFNQSIIDLHYIGGTDLDFLCWTIIQSSEDHERFIARITGKESGGILKSATFKTIVFGYWAKSQYDPRGGEAGAITLTGSLISESKLPTWVPK